jgi:NADH-quinone oxidoreductase subunit E
MSMFSFPTDMNEMMKPMQSMTDWTKLDEMPVSPLMVYPLGAAAAATAIGFGMAGQMAGMMMGTMQAAMQNQSSLLGNHPDLSWIVPTLAEDLAPEEDEAEATDVAPAKAKTADVVTLKPAGKPAPAKSKAKAKPAAAKPANAKAASAKAKVEATEAKPVTVAAVEKLKSDAEVAAGVAGESVAVVDTPAKAAPAPGLEPEDFRRPAEIEKPETPDDLKLISGVGPKLEQVLNGLGIWTFDQIAAWQPEEAAWVDDYLQFSGRIDRDNWISQAGALAKGGATAD